MVWQQALHQMPLIVAAAIAAMSALYVWRHGRSPLPWTGAVVLLAGAEWMLGRVLELASAELWAIALWDKLQFLGIAVIPTAWLVHTLARKGHEEWLTRRNLALLSIVPTVLLLMTLTNEVHGLMWRRLTLGTCGPFIVLNHTPSVGSWLFLGYSGVLVAFGLSLRTGQHRPEPRLYRRQVTTTRPAALVLALGWMPALFDLRPFSFLDPMPILLALISLDMALDASPVRQGDLDPAAHKLILEDTGDSVIVLDEENRIVELNAAAQRLIPRSAPEAIGRPVEQVWADWADKIETAVAGTNLGKEVTIQHGDEQLAYDVRAATLADGRGGTFRRVITVSHTSERKQSEELVRQVCGNQQQGNRQLGPLVAATTPRHLELGLDALLHDIVTAARQCLGFGSVVLYVKDDDSGKLRVHAGLDEHGRQRLEGGEVRWEEVAGLLQTQFQVGQCYFIPHGEFDWEQGLRRAAPRVVREEAKGSGTADNVWRTDDVLLVPLEPHHGKMVGVMSLGLPHDGLRPSEEGQQAAELFAHLVAVSIETARGRERLHQELAERAQAEEALLTLTVELEEGAVDRTAELATTNAQLIHEIREREQIERELRRRNRELLYLQSACAATASTLDLHFVLDNVTWEMTSLLEVESCALHQWSQEADTVSKIAEYGAIPLGEEEREASVEDPVNSQMQRYVLAERCARQTTISQSDVDPATMAYLAEAGIKTWLLLPMLFQDRVVGLVEVRESRVERVFTNEEIALAQLLVSQAASAITNARLYEEIRQRVDELTTLSKVNQAITSTLDLQQSLTAITDHTLRLLNVAAASVALYDEADGCLWFAVASGEGSDFVRNRRLAVGQGIIGWVVEHSEPLLVSDVAQDSRHFSDFDQESGFTTRSIMCVPLQTQGRTIGAIEVMNKEGRPFAKDDLRLLSSLAGSAAAAIANARLYEQAQQEIAERRRVEAALEAERSSLARRVAERTAELREANTELAQAARLKDRFVSNVSHELRTPLSVITLLSGNLDMLYERLDDGKRRKMVQDIREYGRVLNDLIDNVLEISRIDSQRVSHEVRRVDLGHLAHQEAEKQLPLAQKKSQTLHVTGEENLCVQGNDSQLRQVISNLLNNAIKYTPVGGKITCEYRVHAGNGNLVGEWPGTEGLSPDRWAALRVADTGIGISQQDLPHLFERFYRVEAQGNVPGVGLGLSIAKELVGLHNGQIAVASRLGEGTVFAIYLRLLAEEQNDGQNLHDTGG